MRPITHLLIIAMVVGCASTQPLKPTVVIAQTSGVQPVRVATGSAVPVEYRLQVTNPLDHPVTLTTVEIETVGIAGAYSMKRVRHRFSEVIAANGTATIPLRAWVQPLQESDSGKVESPVMLRGIAKFESAGTTIQSAFTGRVR